MRQPTATEIVTNPCLMLEYLSQSYLELIGGKQVVEVVHPGGHGSVRFSRTNLREIEAKISQLQTLCNPSTQHARAIRIGPYRPRHY